MSLGEDETRGRARTGDNGATTGNRGLDLRVVKTREAIEAALERLLESTEYGEITVSAIAREARVGRKTFYSHYGSVADLLEQMASERIAKMVQDIRVTSEATSLESWVRQFTHAALMVLHDSPYLNGNVLRSMSLRNVLDMLRAPLMAACETELSAHGLEKTPRLEMCLAMYLGAIFAAYEAWSTSDRSEDIAEVADLAGRVASFGVVGLLQGEGRVVQPS